MVKKEWHTWVKDGAVLYCAIYTVTTIANSVLYLMQGIRNDPNGNWHELTRAAIVLIGVLAYELAAHLPIKNILMRAAAVYALTMPLVFGTVWMSGFIEPLSPGALMDITVNYSGLFVIVSVIAVVAEKMQQKH